MQDIDYDTPIKGSSIFDTLAEENDYYTKQ
jgi:hypothetical protein